MKTKNMLICGLIGTLIGSGANALDTSEIKAKCEQSDKTVWVEATKVCVPKNPCKNSQYENYCNRIFSTVQTPGPEWALELIKYYLKENGKECNSSEYSQPGLLGQDYVRCHLNDGGYVEFEFDDTDDHGDSAIRGYVSGFCAIYGSSVEGLHDCPNDNSDASSACKKYGANVFCDHIGKEGCYKLRWSNVEREEEGYGYDEELQRCYFSVWDWIG